MISNYIYRYYDNFLFFDILRLPIKELIDSLIGNLKIPHSWLIQSGIPRIGVRSVNRSVQAHPWKYASGRLDLDDILVAIRFINRLI